VNGIGELGNWLDASTYLALKLYFLLVVVGSVPFRKTGFTSK
jgi:hypothetical protein